MIVCRRVMATALPNQIADRLDDEIWLVQLDFVVALRRDDQSSHGRERDKIRLSLDQDIVGPEAASQHNQRQIDKGMRRGEALIA